MKICVIGFFHNIWKEQFWVFFLDGLNANKTISVYNANRVGSPTGKLNDIKGYADVVDPAEPGKLEVKFPVQPVPGQCE